MKIKGFVVVVVFYLFIFIFVPKMHIMVLKKSIIMFKNNIYFSEKKADIILMTTNNKYFGVKT